jgi:hypothetical protein
MEVAVGRMQKGATYSFALAIAAAAACCLLLLLLLLLVYRAHSFSHTCYHPMLLVVLSEMKKLVDEKEQLKKQVHRY